MVAVGGFITGYAAVLTGGFLDFRPVAGEIYMILSAGSSAVAPANSHLYLGYGTWNGGVGTASWVWLNTNAANWDAPPMQKIVVDNTNYLRMINQAAGTEYLSYSAVRLA